MCVAPLFPSTSYVGPSRFRYQAGEEEALMNQDSFCTKGCTILRRRRGKSHFTVLIYTYTPSPDPPPFRTPPSATKTGPIVRKKGRKEDESDRSDVIIIQPRASIRACVRALVALIARAPPLPFPLRVCVLCVCRSSIFIRSFRRPWAASQRRWRW